LQFASGTAEEVDCKDYNGTKKGLTSTSGNTTGTKVPKTGAAMASVDGGLLGQLVLAWPVAFVAVVLGSL
jgi:hypothetical protein